MKLPVSVIIDDFEASTHPKTIQPGDCARHPQAHLLIHGQCNWCLEEKYGNPEDLSDATADLLAEQRAAALERCGITVEGHSPNISGEYMFHGVKKNGAWQIGYLAEDAAWEYAYELADNMMNEGDYI